MKRLLFCFLFSGCFFPGFCQSTSEELEKAYAPFLSKTPLELVLQMKVTDSRDQELTQYIEPTELLQSIFAGFQNAEMENGLFDAINPAACNLDIQFYNLYRSTSGNLFFKANLKWELEKGDFLHENSEGVITLDTVIGSTTISKFLKSDRKEVFVKKFNAKIMGEIKAAIHKNARKQASSLYKVNAFGKYLIPSQRPDEHLLAEQAALNGIANASANMMGFTISSETTVKDFGDVTDIISKKFSGELKSYRILNEYNYKTVDGYFCTIVSFIIKSNK